MTHLTSKTRPSNTTIWPGTWYPLGATYDGDGCNFSVFSEVAERVDLCLFDEDGRERRVPLPESRTFCWHGYVPGVQPGQRYGFRVYGPWDPTRPEPAGRSRLQPAERPRPTRSRIRSGTGSAA